MDCNNGFNDVHILPLKFYAFSVRVNLQKCFKRLSCNPEIKNWSLFYLMLHRNVNSILYLQNSLTMIKVFSRYKWLTVLFKKHVHILIWVLSRTFSCYTAYIRIRWYCMYPLMAVSLSKHKTGEKWCLLFMGT